jgi:transketolase
VPNAFDDTDQLCVNTIRTLALDAVEQAKSGHPGLPLGCAPIGHVLFTRHLRYNPADPAWPGRDRFVLSAGHGCMLLYSLLHLTGYDLPLEELKRFRQWGSMTPGHPEYGHTPGVETTTGPLGQGAATAIGMAIAGKHLEAVYGELAAFRVFVLVSDGDLMEGVSGEASSLAGHLGLDNLVFIYDDNHVSIDGDTQLAFTEDRIARYAAYGWSTSEVSDGNDLGAIDAAVTAAVEHRGQPSFISVRTIIGFGSRDAGTSRAHSDARGPEQQAETKRALGFDPDRYFVIPEAAGQRFREAGSRGAGLQRDWEAALDAHPKASELRRIFAGDTPRADLPTFPAGDPIATRAASGKVIAALAEAVPELVGGSADLTPSNNTRPPDATDFEPGSHQGRYLRFGVREHGMAAVTNGLALSGLRPYAGTFFNFLDYCKPAVRLSALMNIPVTWVFTHDSIGLGEDGPTHQPVEQLASLRATPNMTVFRPADANETAAGRPRRVRAGGRRRPRAAPDCDRLGGGPGVRRARPAGRAGDPLAGGVAAQLGAVRGAAGELSHLGHPARCGGAGDHRGRIDGGLGAVRGAARGDHRPRPLRGLGSRRHRHGQPGVHGRAGGGRGRAGADRQPGSRVEDEEDDACPSDLSNWLPRAPAPGSTTSAARGWNRASSGACWTTAWWG